MCLIFQNIWLVFFITCLVYFFMSHTSRAIFNNCHLYSYTNNLQTRNKTQYAAFLFHNKKLIFTVSKNAYEQQNSKLFEFVDFVKRYFPYVEKLMPTIKFLRDTLNFGDAVIRKLCTFKDVSIKGELYSREFNQHFRADKTICSLKEDKDGNFNLNIDGVSHVSWFRRKKDEFMQSLGMPTRKQDKGIRL